MNFRVQLDVFRGPLDLLLYLVRKHEVDVADIPVAPIAEQFLEYLSVMEQIDVAAVGDFLEVASWLMEIKSRMVLPRGDEVEEQLEDPRQELVQRLLEYKKYRDAASILEERSRAWQQRFARAANDLAERRRDLADEPIREIELWDLVSAFGRILRDTELVQPSSIVYDDTPIHVYMDAIRQRLKERGRVAYHDLFEPGMNKSSLISVFLAVLELVRNYGVRAEQNELFGEIWLAVDNQRGGNLDEPIDLARVDQYAGSTNPTGT
jgi:segregation and condensation protein A